MLNKILNKIKTIYDSSKTYNIKEYKNKLVISWEGESMSKAIWTKDQQKYLDDKFTAIDKKFEAIDNRFEAIDKRLDSLEAKMDKVIDLLQQVISCPTIQKELKQK